MEKTQLQPKIVFDCFAEVNKIPRPSNKEEKMMAYLMDFGHKLGLETLQDETGNVLIRKPATPGYENLETTVPGIYVAGDADGIEEASAAMVEGRLAGCAAAGALGHNAEEAAKQVEAARADLNELRSGPTGGKIRAGIKKMHETKEAMNNAQ